MGGVAIVSSGEVRIELIEVSVVIVAEVNNPTVLNPDFLRHNGIVSADRVVSGEPVTTPILSEVSFEDGLVVRADPARVTFSQAVKGNAREGIDSPAVAKGYLKTIPHVPYTALGVNPKAVIRNPPFSRLSKMLHAEGDWMAFGASMPQFELKATYQMKGRRLTLTLQEAKGEQGTFMLCDANIHRDVKETNQQMRVNSLLSMLNCWEDDLDQFYAVVDQALRLDEGNVR